MKSILLRLVCGSGKDELVADEEVDRKYALTAAVRATVTSCVEARSMENPYWDFRLAIEKRMKIAAGDTTDAKKGGNSRRASIASTLEKLSPKFYAQNTAEDSTFLYATSKNIDKISDYVTSVMGPRLYRRRSSKVMPTISPEHTDKFLWLMSIVRCRSNVIEATKRISIIQQNMYNRAQSESPNSFDSTTPLLVRFRLEMQNTLHYIKSAIDRCSESGDPATLRILKDIYEDFRRNCSKWYKFSPRASFASPRQSVVSPPPSKLVLGMQDSTPVIEFSKS
eukprot:Colp12_sorted_trinity150504_noHs@13764